MELLTAHDPVTLEMLATFGLEGLAITEFCLEVKPDELVHARVKIIGTKSQARDLIGVLRKHGVVADLTHTAGIPMFRRGDLVRLAAPEVRFIGPSGRIELAGNVWLADVTTEYVTETRPIDPSMELFAKLSPSGLWIHQDDLELIEPDLPLLLEEGGADS